MGLDMYLSAKRYAGDWNHMKDEERTAYRDVMRAVGKPGYRCEGSPSATVSVGCAYWRKANQIHAWFVNNVQGGEDDCKTYHVEREELEKLRDLCREVIEGSKLVAGAVTTGQTLKAGVWTNETTPGKVVANPDFAAERLPTQSGCFFGGTDYDEYYVEDLKDTVRQIDDALGNFGEGWEFEYSSSW